MSDIDIIQLRAYQLPEPNTPRPAEAAPRALRFDRGLKTVLLAVRRRARSRQKEGPALPWRRRWWRWRRLRRRRLIVRIIHLPDKRREAGLGLGATRGQPQAGYRDAARQHRAGNDPVQGAVGVHGVMPLYSSQPRRAALTELFASQGPNTWGS